MSTRFASLAPNPTRPSAEQKLNARWFTPKSPPGTFSAPVFRGFFPPHFLFSGRNFRPSFLFLSAKFTPINYAHVKSTSCTGIMSKRALFSSWNGCMHFLWDNEFVLSFYGRLSDEKMKKEKKLIQGLRKTKAFSHCFTPCPGQIKIVKQKHSVIVLPPAPDK